MHEPDLNASASFITLKENPQLLALLINKYVRVELIKNTTIYGYVHSIDPIAHSIIVLEPNNEKFKTTIIPGHAVLEVTEIEADLSIQPPKRENVTSELDESTLKCKQKLISWFKQNLLPVTESEDKIVFGNVLILPPYTVSDVCTDNPMVAMQVKNIMSKMPLDFVSS